MQQTFTCARDCPGRSATCHSTCEKYLREKENYSKEKEAKRRVDDAYRGMYESNLAKYIRLQKKR